jgi:hypothetical protein
MKWAGQIKCYVVLSIVKKFTPHFINFEKCIGGPFKYQKSQSSWGSPNNDIDFFLNITIFVQKNEVNTRWLLIIEIYFGRLATHLRFYVGTLDCQIQIWQFRSQNKSNCHYLFPES